MAFQWPWIKREPGIDVEAVARAAAQEAATEAVRQVGTEIARAAMSTFPANQTQGAGMNSLTNPADPMARTAKYPIYGFDQPIWYSTPQAPSRRPQSVISVQTMRQLADVYDVLRACIQHLKDEVIAVPVQVVAKDKSDKRRKGQIKTVTQFLETQGGLGGVGERRSQFEGKLLEDLLVVGAGCTFFWPNRAGGLSQVLPIDAATIRPRVDAWGWPGPGECAYEQWIYGVLIGGFTRDDIRYDGLATRQRSYSPYPASPVEWLINTVNSALRADDWNRSWLTDGTTVDDKINLPEAWTPEQIKTWSAFWNDILSGNSRERQKTKFLPGGSQPFGQHSRKDADFQEFELWLLRRTCSVMGVQPASVGFAGEQYKVSQSDSMESTSAFGVGTLLEWRKALYDDICVRLGCPDVEIQNVNAREEKALERATRNQILVSAGIKSINEARADEGLDTIDDGDEPLVSNLMIPLSQAVKPPDPVDPNAAPGASQSGQAPKEPKPDANDED